METGTRTLTGGECTRTDARGNASEDEYDQEGSDEPACHTSPSLPREQDCSGFLTVSRYTFCILTARR
ncbi:hypothetical protein ACFQS4_14475 [Saliphagus sp. GCM10025317]